MAGRFDSPKAALWRARLKRFESTSLTVAQFCAREGCSVASFYQWRRKLQPTSEAPQKTPAEAFRPLTIAFDAPRVAIVFRDGTRLEMAGADHALVCALVREILHVPSSSGGA